MGEWDLSLPVDVQSHPQESLDFLSRDFFIPDPNLRSVISLEYNQGSD